MRDDRIVLMLGDTMAHNPRNVHPGSVFVDPGHATDLFAGAEVDYKREDVTPENLPRVLTGKGLSGANMNRGRWGMGAGAKPGAMLVDQSISGFV